MTDIKIITKPSKNSEFMNVAVEYNGQQAVLESFLPHQIGCIASSVKDFEKVASGVVIQNFHGGVKISAPNIRRNATRLFKPETEFQELVSALAVKLISKKASLAPS